MEQPRIRAKYTPLEVHSTAASTADDLTYSGSDTADLKVDIEADVAPVASSVLAGGRQHLGLCQTTFFDNWWQVVIFVAYVALYLCYIAWIHVTNGITYSPVMLVMAILLMKLFLSIGGYLLVDGTVPQLIRTIAAHRRHLFLYAFPAVAYATTDSLSVYCMRHLDPSTFAVLYNVRVVCVLFLFQRLLRVQLTRMHWLSMGCVVAGCVLKELPNLVVAAATEAAAATAGGTTDRLKLVLVVLVMANVAAFAAVYNERLLKEEQLSLNVQNIALYSWAILTTIVYSILWPSDKSRGLLSTITSPAEWLTVWTHPMIVAVILSACYGLVTSSFIKSLNNVVREIASAVQILGTIPLNVLIFGYTVCATDILAIGAVVAGIIIYNKHPIKK